MKTLFLIMCLSILPYVAYSECSKLVAYPNPSSSGFNIATCKTNQTFRIYTLYGFLVYTSKTDERGEAVWSDLDASTGIYVIEIGGLKTKLALIR